ncbi:MAG: hypothetical protein ACQPRH_04090 [Solitalea-like symbiont of Tyrophagus putrescentiae]
MRKLFTIIILSVIIFSATKFVETRNLKQSDTFGAANIYTDNKSFASSDINALSSTSLLFYAVVAGLEHIMATDTDAVNDVLEATGATADVYITAGELAAGAAEFAAETAAAAAEATEAILGLISKKHYLSNINANIAMAGLD